ncbi:MAG: orotidine-5'-phosphate decarboxylase [Gammaproteobacteria bacterium HGW-Gammaproteobacteria-4]|jgi:orotidine-5'-phosphate decarboxylase|nr:MAG: orotidine-5'-phosphate decarboxylase [Gammaproteobacteria bacterium HGW-Gammaproteobacteria-5]PKM08497.1 MAG: orotidine-5'-phosphate decarboxylase [Gammaproteobacteria bacterium HGW-Gammaproteobacteria-4]
MIFIQSLRQRWLEANTLLCVGLDPEPEGLPAVLDDDADAVFTFCRAIVDATAPYVCAFKPQIAHFAALGAEDALQRLIAYIHAAHPGIPVILDAKRGDIGSTARHYASEAFDRYRADAVTVNPYLGRDSVQPFLNRADKGVVVLCRTSNPGSGEFQDLRIDGKPLYQHVAHRVAHEWNGNGNCLLVIGATWPDELAQVRSLVGDLPLLVPGVGAQGGDVAAVLRSGADSQGNGLIISSSRAILYASEGADYAEAAAAAALRQRDAINAQRR